MIWAISAGQPDLMVRGRAALEAGLDRLLIREPCAPDGLLALIADFPDRVVLHGRIENAAAIRAETGVGVHLSASAALEDWIGSSGAIGQSCHSLTAVRNAQLGGCSYVFLSPIWQAFSKPLDRRATLGPEALLGANAVALGGITVERSALCRQHGAVGVATMSGILFDPDPGAAVARWRAGWNGE